MIRFNILTLFPEMFDALNTSILAKAQKKEKIKLNIINIRDFANNKHNKVDDTPYGGRPGMVMMPDVIYRAYNSFDKLDKHICIYLSPKGQKYAQRTAYELSNSYNDITLLCGHYEGIDQRIIDKIVDMEISIGDFVLTGGELPAMVLVDSISRLIPGVITNESLENETFSNNLLEYPQYTKPYDFEGEKVPDVLLSGDHKKIDDWRKNKSIILTKQKRPDLLEERSQNGHYKSN